MARLLVETGQEAGIVYPVNSTELTIGRGADCDIQVVDRRVSRHHAIIKLFRGNCVVEDLDSRNGTFLNHQPLMGLAQLRNGDRISVGGTVFAFEADPEDFSEQREKLHRVRIAPGGNQNLKAERTIESDTAPIISHTPVSQDAINDPLQRLRVLYQVSESLRAELDLESLLAKIMDIIWMVANPDRGIILTADRSQSGVTLTPAVVKLREETDEDIIISQGIVEKSMQERSAILMADAPSDARFAENNSVYAGSIRSAICTPLIANGQSLGVIYIDTQEMGDGEAHSFSNEDLELVSGISVQAALAIQNARLHTEALRHQRTERELEIARDIQVGLLPRGYPVIDGMSFAATCRPARQVGGDYYDFFKLKDDRLAIVIGDASGKGVPAAILISTVRATCRAQAQVPMAGTVSEIISAVNRGLCDDSQCENFVSLFMLIFDPAKQEFSYTNAGHVPPILIRENGNIERMTEGGCLLGVGSDTSYDQATIPLHSGDALILYTDGVTDAHNMRKELFTEERLIDVAKRNRANDAGKICESIFREVLQFRESTEAFDDLTLLVIKII